MLKVRVLKLAGILLLAVLLAIGVTRLFTLRYQTGDNFPAYSTLRTDPLGARAIFDALDSLAEFEVSRNFLPLEKQPVTRRQTLVYAGVSRESYWRKPELKHARALLVNGSRLVFAFSPENWVNRPTFGPPVPAATPAPATKPTAKAGESGEPDSPDQTDAPEPIPVEPPPRSARSFLPNEGTAFSKVLGDWGAAFSVRSGSGNAYFKHPATATDYARTLGLEPKLTWHSALYFSALAPEWRVLYECEDRPVVIERPFGDGTIVLASDSFFLSNEALRTERRPALLEWFAGPFPRIVFDEEHHGIAESPGIATLARKYRLGGTVGVLGFLAALFLWKNAAPLLPRRGDSEDHAGEVEGKSADEGLIRLLRRNIPESRILAQCIESWERSAAREIPEEERAHIASVFRAHQSRGLRNVAAAYRTIAEGLNRPKT